MKQTTAVFVSGPPASGKTTFARGLARRLNMSFIDLDTLSEPFLRPYLAQQPGYKDSQEYRDSMRDREYEALVLHGSSGVTDEELRRIISTKFAKINIGTVLRKTFINSIRETLQAQPNLKAHDKLLQISSGAVVEKVKEKIRILKIDGKASLYV